MQQAPKFATAFVSPRTRNTTTPGLKAEKIFGVDLTYNLNLPYVKARVSGYYTTFEDQSKVISFYDDTRSSFTNFAMSGIDKRHYGLELGLSVPVWNGLSVDVYKRQVQGLSAPDVRGQQFPGRFQRPPSGLYLHCKITP